MAAKINIASSTHSTAELSTILSEYTNAPIKSSKQLFGGYSGSSYLVELDASPSSPTQYVLKVSNGYTHDDAEFMCRTAAYLGSVGFEDCCLPIPKMKQKRDPSYVYVSKLESNGVPSFLLTYVKGQQADKIMRESPHLAKVVMRGIGGGLGRMHALSSGIDAEKAKASGIRWYENDGGCCDVQDQYEDKILGKIMSDPDASQHEFVEFYKRELTDLKNELGLVKGGMFDMGVTHGDPFADNIMSNPENGELVAFIDMEDVCVGPLLFDLACCSIGSCFTNANEDSEFNGKYNQILDFDLLSSFLGGYTADRKLPSIEVEHFVAFMRLTLLCNCSWRFIKFNIQQKDVPAEAKNSYVELQDRIKYLREESVVARIMEQLNI